ncbi:MAG: MFS transporter [bacterium]
MEQTRKEKLFTKQFWQLSISVFLFFISFNMIVPELPNFITQLGGEDYKGWIITMFTIAAGLSRPFSGKLSDSIGRVPVMLVGIFVTAFCGLLYPFATSVALFLGLRFLHGFSTGFAPTGSMAYIGDVAPSHRRGEAIGLVSMFGTVGMAVAPVLGSIIATYISLDAMFYMASAFGVISLLIVRPLTESLSTAQKATSTVIKNSFKVNKADFYEPRVLRPATLLMLASVPFGAVIILIPDFSLFVGLDEAYKGVFFAVFTGASIITRVLSGKLSDRIGRVKTLRMGFATLVIALTMLAFSTEPIQFFIAGFLFGIALGNNSPTMMAWTIDLSNDKFRGRAIATAFIALEIGIGSGSLIGSWLYGNNSENFLVAFIGCAVLALLGLIILFTKMKPVPEID